MATFAPVGSALPPRRDQLTVKPVSTRSDTDWGDSINVPMVRDRMMEYFEREQLPGDVKGTLAAALSGDVHLQSLLFTAMIDSWPKLQANIAEIQRRVATAPWKVHPFAKRGEKPTSKAEALAKEVENLVWSMKPRASRRELGFEGTVKALVLGYYYGHSVAEIRWEQTGREWRPRCTKAVPARFYGYPYDAYVEGDGEDRLMFDPAGAMGSRSFIDFPENRFLIAINGVHMGHPTVAAPLRALAGYWLAAVYGLKWFINFTQLYGIPWRHAQVADMGRDRNVVERALAEIGSKGYIVTAEGTKVNVLDSSKSGDSLPQKALIDLADDQCDIFILGQTLTSGTDNSGSRALGEVHAETLGQVVDGVTDFVGEILTHQLIPAIVTVNWGENQEGTPEMWGKREQPKDTKAAAETLEAAKRLGMKVGRDFGYEELGIPIPAEDEELLFDPSEPDDEEQQPAPGAPPKPGSKQVEKKAVEAADASAPITVDELSSSVLEGLTGVASEWLSPVRPFFERLAALAMSSKVTDEDFVAALEKAQKELPEIFDLMDTQAIEEAFTNAISSAALAGSVSRYEK